MVGLPLEHRIEASKISGVFNCIQASFSKFISPNDSKTSPVVIPAEYEVNRWNISCPIVLVELDLFLLHQQKIESLFELTHVNIH
jgi:hypothetical protein